MTRRMQRMMQQKQGAPRQTTIAGQPHMLAYINEAERQMLKRAGGAEMPGPAGIPSYFDFWKNTFGGGNSFSQSVANAFTPNDGTSYVGGSLVNDSNPNQNVGPARDADMFAGSNYAPTINAGTSDAVQVTYNDDNNSAAATTNPTLVDTGNVGDVFMVGDKYAVRNADGSINKFFGETMAQLHSDYITDSGIFAPVTSETTNFSSPTSVTAENLAEEFAAPYTELGNSLQEAGLLSLGGKQTPEEPFNAGNPPILEYDGGNNSYSVVGALDPNAEPSMATNEDGSLYVPYDGMSPFYNPEINANALDQYGNTIFPNGSTIGPNNDNSNAIATANTNAVNTLLTTGNDGNMIVPGDGGSYSTLDGVNLNGQNFGNYQVFPYSPGNTYTLEETNTGNNTTTTTNVEEGGGGPPVVEEPAVNQALIDALARRDEALSGQLGNVASAFGFSTDDYYNQLGTDYREGGLSDAFTTAYDDAIRGIYDTFKSAGMLTQQGVDDKMGILSGAEGGEANRLDSIVDQYTSANRGYVDSGRSGMEGTLRGYVTDTEDIPTIDQQTAQILGYDVAGNSQQYKTPQEGNVVEFFTDFVKRSYDPSYNVDPTAVASGGPKKVSGSVDQLGAGTQPSSLAGILDPVRGGSVKVVS